MKFYYFYQNNLSEYSFSKEKYILEQAKNDKTGIGDVVFIEADELGEAINKLKKIGGTSIWRDVDEYNACISTFDFTDWYSETFDSKEELIAYINSHSFTRYLNEEALATDCFVHFKDKTIAVINLE